MNLVDRLAELAQAHPERLAFIQEQGSKSVSITYGKLYEEVCAGAESFRKAGLKQGDTILFLHHINIQLYAALLATFHAGMTAMFVDLAAGDHLIDHSLQLHPAQAYFASPKAHLLRFHSASLRKIPRHFSSKWAPFTTAWPKYRAAVHSPAQLSPDTPALITFTSGSTGKPKAACRTHGFLTAQHQALSEELEMQEAQVDLTTLPIFALANLASGMTSVIADSDLSAPASVDGTRIQQQMQRYPITRCAASPAFFRAMLDQNAFPDFKTVYTGGAPVFPSMLERISQQHPSTQLVTVYGSTEAEPISHCNWSHCRDEDLEAMKNGHGLLVGQPNAYTKIAIIKDHNGKPLPKLSPEGFEAITLATGSPGEIVVTGDHVLKGYLNGLGDDETKIHVEDTVWHRTGDAGYLDEDGRIWLLGRCSAKLAPKAGETSPVYPFGVEAQAMYLPGVERAALVDHEGKRLLAIQGKASDPSLSSLQAQWNIDQIFPMGTIPVDKRHNAKIEYPALRILLAELGDNAG
ncbi:olefin beta-lactone synthetase [Rubritalea halochordaticola]|uniref:Olefin beta-lactone synthetase n=1 Tax=Rubritalea halochordaticola TaxID=714537 RepID=A0ABP9UUL8_9BACT